MEKLHIYKYDRFGVLFIAIAFFVLPLFLATLEFLSTGPAYLAGHGEGRRELPNWLTYCFMLIPNVYFAIVYYIPSIRSIFRGYVFKINEEILVVQGIKIKKEEIKYYGFSILSGFYIFAQDRKFHIGYSHNMKGQKALDLFLEDKERRL